MAENDREQVCKYSIGSELQPGVVSYRQKPSSTDMEMWGLRVTDDYDSWSVTLPSGDAASYAATQLALGSKEAMKQAQVTSTTIEGGMSRVDVKIQSLEKNPDNEGTEEDEEPGSEDPEDDPTEDEEEEAGYGPNHAKTTSAEINF